MHIVEQILLQLDIMGLSTNPNGLTKLQSKDGIHVYRVVSPTSSYVLKYFEQPEYRREIAAYRLLYDLGVPTLEVAAVSDSALLLADIADHPQMRLGYPADLADPGVGEALAMWYRQLHSSGATYLAESGDWPYREHDIITHENIRYIAECTRTTENPVWALAERQLPLVLDKISELGETLTFNDFFWTNLAVARDQSTALMFDYNYLGTGLRYSDIRNVCASLEADAAAAFLSAYGHCDLQEKALDEFTSVIVNLVQACKRSAFPHWAEDSLRALHDGSLIDVLRQLF